ncbi:sulfotransferase [Brevundimonas sp. 2R-24]|uniref:Sulfotransferase n=1 Tax=Peiella sedimenti TaxID=3061083 RepID=A0ABT8SN66_9CAUL|nr:sulfotransferase [Caulobacteraceae bacterium XZ-24]
MTDTALAAPRLPVFRRPIFIMAAPRSGSTALFETLAVTPQVATVGGEAHWLVEGLPPLRPGAPGVESNRLTRKQATPEIQGLIRKGLAEKLVLPGGLPPKPGAEVRLLEKTPKNALRIPFFNAVFSDALFIYLWRRPEENISSIMDAWRAGRWVTYRTLQGWDGPWSLLLPPGWKTLRGRPLAEIAAFQWAATNTVIMDDLAKIDGRRKLTVEYDAFVEDPAMVVQKICDFAGLAYDSALFNRTTGPLPNSRYTLSAPDRDKWLKNKDEIDGVLPAMRSVLERAQDYA